MKQQQPAASYHTGAIRKFLCKCAAEFWASRHARTSIECKVCSWGHCVAIAEDDGAASERHKSRSYAGSHSDLAQQVEPPSDPGEDGAIIASQPTCPVHASLVCFV